MVNTQLKILPNMLYWQVGMPAVLSLLAGIIGGWQHGISLFLGGVVVFVGTLVGLKLVTSSAPHSGTEALLYLLKAEVAKIVVIALLLLALFKTYQSLVPWALMLGLTTAALASARLLVKSQLAQSI